ncbi:TIGR03089 family protein [Flexivirga oryzae]|uniref:TIGR03089 family protein n=1 Tax=Flexivirga oryzae TaxID=1794944 RepID=A0A839N506_9MICO|nr:hypothetical protein [Flexivirga oryzae]
MNSDDLRTALLAGDLTRPRLTWYDGGTGERVDLSGKTLAKWVAKAANWLDQEMALSPGDRLSLTIPADHWRAIYWSLAGWTRGLVVTTESDADAAVTLEGGSGSADLVEPAAALAPSPLQAFSDAMPPPVGPAEYAAPELPGDLPAGSRVLLGVTAAQRAPEWAAALMGHGCSVVVMRNFEGEIGPEKRASEAVEVVL